MTANRYRLAVLSLLVAVLLGGGLIVVQDTFFRAQTFTADFSSATGLYPGDDVRVAGVKVGTIESVDPQPDHAVVTLEVEHGISIPADAHAVIVAQNLVAARYIALAPLYAPGTEKLTDGAAIPNERTAIPVEWDDVKTQLSTLATELGPDVALSSSSVGRFVESAADAMAGNGQKLRSTFAQLSALARILAEGSGDVVSTIKNLQLFVNTLRDSSDDIVVFQDRLATLGTVLSDSRSDLDAAMSELAVAVGEIERFVAETRDKTAEQVQRLANSTQILVDGHMDLENILHLAPTGFANAYQILNPNTPGALGTFVLSNFANPVTFLCGAIGGVANKTAPETAKLCAQYLGPALRNLNFNILPQPPLNPFLAPVQTPDKLAYADPALAPGGAGGAPTGPEEPPAVSAYTGMDGDVPAPPGFVPPPPPPAGAPALPAMLLPAEATPPSGDPQALPQNQAGRP